MSLALLTAIAFGSVVAGAVLAILTDAFGSRKAAVAFAALGALACAGAFACEIAAVKPATVWSMLRGGGADATVGCVIAALAAVALLGGWDELSRHRWGGSLAGLVGFGAAASIVVAQTTDLTLLLISLETAAACGYVLVSAEATGRAREAAMKYFVQGTIATSLFVFGMAVLIGVFLPTGDMVQLSQALGAALPLSVAAVASVLVLAALAFKSGAAPFHSWAPDAYETSSPSSAAFLASGPKVGSVAALAILGSLVMTERLDMGLSTVVAVLAVVSILVGSVTALRQRSYTRMLGYAGVAQVGYALIAVATPHVPSIAVFFIVTYAIATTGTFLAASAFKTLRPDWDGSIEGLSGISREAPMLAFSVSMLLISLAGIPPLLGFWSKFQVFGAALVSGVSSLLGGAIAPGWIGLATGLAGVIGSVVSLGYYGAVLRVLYETPPDDSRACEPIGDPVTVGESEASRTDTEDGPVARRSGSAAVWVGILAIVAAATGIAPLPWGSDVLLRLFA